VEVLRRAQGKCEYCLKDAPFIKVADKEPYLEVHHIQHLSEGGKDIIENAIALCPNCHKNAHFGGLKITISTYK
jgi:5-methylcytosine-specific restriction protein A